MRISSLLSLTLLAVPVTAFAQDEGGEPAPTAKDEAPAAKDDAAPGEGAVAPTAAPVASAAAEGEPFKIRRGWHAELDIGVFFTFGGINNNAEAFLIHDSTLPEDPTTNPALPTKALSNVQPMLALFFGYDVVQDPKYSFAAGLRLGAMYSGGSSRLTAADVDATRPNSDDRKNLATRANDYAILETGVGLGFSYLMTDRVALTVKANGGLAIVDPNPEALANDRENGGKSAFSGMVGGGLGVEYFTLLNDFSVGLDAQFLMIFAAGGIPSLSLTIPVKYTF